MKPTYWLAILMVACLCSCTRKTETTVDIKGDPGIEFKGYLIGSDGNSIDISGTTPWHFSHTVQTMSSSSKEERYDAHQMIICENVPKGTTLQAIRIAKLKLTRIKGDGLLRVSIGEGGRLLFDKEQTEPEEIIEYTGE